MGATKDYQLKQAEEEIARLNREFAEARPDLIAEGWDREMWEAYMEASEKDD